jgi:hypothetical protein
VHLYIKDESYTPKQIAIKAGNTLEDLQNIQTLDLDEPMGIFNDCK